MCKERVENEGVNLRMHPSMQFPLFQPRIFLPCQNFGYSSLSGWVIHHCSSCQHLYATARPNWIIKKDWLYNLAIGIYEVSIFEFFLEKLTFLFDMLQSEVEHVFSFFLFKTWTWLDSSFEATQVRQYSSTLKNVGLLLFKMNRLGSPQKLQIN